MKDVERNSASDFVDLINQPRPLALIVLFLVYLNSLIFYIVSLVVEDSVLNYTEFNLDLSLVSLLIFISIVLIGSFSRSFYFSCLPLIALTVPNAVNDLFPAFWAGPSADRGVASVSIINHIDLYLLLGVFLFTESREVRRTISINYEHVLLFSVLTALFLGLVGWLITNAFTQYNSLLFFGNSFQLRYLLYVYLFSRIVTAKDVVHFNYGFLCAVGLVLLEAGAYTIIFNLPELTSGNFGTNTLGVLLGVAIIYASCINGIPMWMKTLLLLLMGVGLLMTGTRSALLAFIFSTILVPFVLRFGFLRIGLILGACAVCIVISNWAVVSAFLDPFMLLIQTDYSLMSSQGLVGGPFSSAITRVSLWVASVDMVSDYPFGVGFSLFNFLKPDYGFSVPVFIDPHNDYLNFFVQYGILSGVLIMYTLYVYPLQRLYARGFDGDRAPIVHFMLFILITSLTNSNLNKHQFFFIFAFLVFVSMRHRSNGCGKPQNTQQVTRFEV